MKAGSTCNVSSLISALVTNLIDYQSSHSMIWDDFVLVPLVHDFWTIYTLPVTIQSYIWSIPSNSLEIPFRNFIDKVRLENSKIRFTDQKVYFNSSSFKRNEKAKAKAPTTVRKQCIYIYCKYVTSFLHSLRRKHVTFPSEWNKGE